MVKVMWISFVEIIKVLDCSVDCTILVLNVLTSVFLFFHVLNGFAFFAYRFLVLQHVRKSDV
jgi:hypothetical protein